MMRIAMSRAASGLLRALLERSGADSDRILLSDLWSEDWRSLTLEGERHQLCLRVAGSDAGAVVARMSEGLEDAEFRIPGQIVADILVAEVSPARDGSLLVTIEALTVSE